MSDKVCPWWSGCFLMGPLRRIKHNPEKILGGYVKTGMKVIDIGCGMGYFTLPIAKLVGKQGHVLAIDIQEKMLSSLEKRTRNTNLASIIEVHSTLKQSGLLLLTEPIGHVAQIKFDAELSMAQSRGFNLIETPKIINCFAAILKKQKI